MPTCFFLSDQIILCVWRICDWDIYTEAWPHSLKAHNSKRLQDIEEDCLRTPTFTLIPPSRSYQILNHIVVIVAFVAIVVDPIRTISAGKVNLGAFRTYPKGYKPPDEGASEYQTIPLNKIEDFGVHCKQYYSLDVTYFKSGMDKSLLDSLWNHYWVNTLSSSTLLTNAEYTTGQVS